MQLGVFGFLCIGAFWDFWVGNGHCVRSGITFFQGVCGLDLLIYFDLHGQDSIQVISYYECKKSGDLFMFRKFPVRIFT